MSNARNLSKFKPSSSGLVETADIADDAVSTDQIANNAVINTSGAITTTGAFTSVGIDDNADANAITIDSSENITIGTAGTGASSTSPKYLSLGSTFSSVAGDHPKLKLYEASDGNEIGIGISSNQMDFQGTSTDFDYVFYGNGNKLMHINGTGEITKPNQPCFSAYISSGGHDFVVGDTTPETIVFNGEHFDNTNSHSNGIFTAPVTGKYFFNSTISFYGTDTLRVHDFAWAWYKDDAAYITHEIGNYIQESGASEFNTLSISTIISLNAQQNVRTKMYSFGSPLLAGKINIPTGTRSGWVGFLIG